MPDIYSTIDAKVIEEQGPPQDTSPISRFRRAIGLPKRTDTQEFGVPEEIPACEYLMFAVLCLRSNL